MQITWIDREAGIYRLGDKYGDLIDDWSHPIKNMVDAPPINDAFRKRRSEKRDQMAREREELLAQGLQKCCMCGEIKPLDAFYPRSSRHDGTYNSRCKDCQREYNRNRRLAKDEHCQYVVYDGDAIIAIGTAEECASRLSVKESTIRWYASASAHRNGGICAEKVDV